MAKGYRLWYSLSGIYYILSDAHNSEPNSYIGRIRDPLTEKGSCYEPWNIRREGEGSNATTQPIRRRENTLIWRLCVYTIEN